ESLFSRLSSPHFYSPLSMPAVDPRSSPSVDGRVDDKLSIESITALLDRSSSLLTRDPFEIRRLHKLHQESVAKVATEVAHCNGRLLRLESILTRQRTEIVAERSHIQRLLETLEFHDRQMSRKLDYMKRRVNKMMTSADRDLAKQQFYLKKCSLYELDDAIETIQHSVDHDMQLIATPSSASRESVASSQASSAHSRATIDTRRYAKPAEQVIDKAVLSTWEVSRSLSHLSGHDATPSHIKKGARDLLAMIERMATLLSGVNDEEATDRTQHTNGTLTTMSSSSLETFSDMGNDLVVEL
ncbi:hypothetical protein PRIPAC_83831, partial [Pristionchus pacificus]|uniref:Uncharacterized protein n=1 Tax=Pristionchus pacificus TaxID=54126 RepID=A0A2A6CC45_PRIPA